jgi:WD40 repeat protein
MIASASEDNSFAWSDLDGSNGGSSDDYVSPFGAVAFTPDGSNVVAGRGANLEDWVFGVPADENGSGDGNTLGSVNAIAFNPKLSSSFSLATNRGAELWTYSRGSAGVEGYQLLTPHVAVTDIAYNPAGTFLAGVVMEDGSSDISAVQIWDARNGKQVRSFMEPGASALAFSPDGKWLAVSTVGSVEVYELPQFRVAYKIERLQYVGNVFESSGQANALAFSPNSRILAFAGGLDLSNNRSTIELWSFSAKRRAALLSGFPAYVYALSFSPNGAYLASGQGNDGCNACYKGSVYLWNVRSLIFSPR